MKLKLLGAKSMTSTCIGQSELDETIEFIQRTSTLRPSIGVVLGSGLSNVGKLVEADCKISYQDIPHFHRPTVEGHPGQLILGQLRGVNLAILVGRLHNYENLSPAIVAFPIYTLKKLGCHKLLITNAAGAINKGFSVGNLVMITDHINLCATNPLIGIDANLGHNRFVDMGNAYSASMQKAIQQAAAKLDIKVKKGVYAGVLGPTYETPAEVKMLRTLGVDLVGMSTVHEVIAAQHCGLITGAISCITNSASDTDQSINHTDVQIQAQLKQETFGQLVSQTICQLK